MGERNWARLTIGGQVPRRLLTDALETLAGCRLDECLEDGRVVVEDPEASWGGFSELEAWLEGRGIPFDLESAACPGAWPDMLVHFRPGPGACGVCRRRQSCGAGDPAVDTSDGAEALSDPEESARVARAGVPGGPGPRTDHMDAG